MPNPKNTSRRNRRKLARMLAFVYSQPNLRLIRAEYTHPSIGNGAVLTLTRAAAVSPPTSPARVALYSDPAGRAWRVRMWFFDCTGWAFHSREDVTMCAASGCTLRFAEWRRCKARGKLSRPLYVETHAVKRGECPLPFPGWARGG